MTQSLLSLCELLRGQWEIFPHVLIYRPDPTLHIGAESIDESQHVVRYRQLRIVHERRQIHGEAEGALLVGSVGGEVGRVGESAAGGGQIVALAASDL